MTEQEVNEIGNFRFQNCAYRSDDPETKSTRTCSCPTITEVTGFHCSHHNLFPLDPKFCTFCDAFEQKELENGEN